MQTQPPMMSFKQFLFSVNGNAPNKMSPEESNKLYNEYKIKFRREQTVLFFGVHKHEEWFRLRYHPVESAKRKEEHRETIRRRLQTFMQLLGYFGEDGDDEESNSSGISLEISSDLSKKRLFKFLDAVMIKLEGGTDKDLEILDSIYELESVKSVEAVVADEKEANTNGDENTDKEEEKEDEGVVVKEEKEMNGDGVKKETNGEKTDSAAKTNGTKRVEEKKAAAISVPQKTQSIFFKHLPVIVTRGDLEKVV